MRCPFCHSNETQVIDSRSSEEGWAIRRRRKCPNCGKRFTTYERVELALPAIIKKGGARTEFDAKKLRASMMLALRKRPVPLEKIDEAVSNIEQRLMALGEREVKGRYGGELLFVRRVRPLFRKLRAEKLKGLVGGERLKRLLRRGIRPHVKHIHQLQRDLSRPVAQPRPTGHHQKIIS